MSNLVNSSVLTMNASGKGYNPYRAADGKFTNGPAATHYFTFGKFAEGSSDQGEAKAVVKSTLSGMLRLGVELEKGDAKSYIESVEKRTGGETEFSKLLKDIPEGASQQIVGKAMTTGYKSVQKQISQFYEHPTQALDASLNKKQKSYFERSKKFLDKSGYVKAQGEVYSALAALCATARASVDMSRDTTS